MADPSARFSASNYSSNNPIPEHSPANRRKFPMRAVEINALKEDGSHRSAQISVPALPLFDAAFSAFTHGSAVQTKAGHVPVEDLLPGDEVLTTDGQAEKVMWIGSATYAQSEISRRSLLVRLFPDSFGFSIPSTSLTLGPAARVLKTPARLRGVMEGAPLLTPVKQFEDGNMVTVVSPPTAIRLFHICLARHSVINVGGLSVESYHPGKTALNEVTPILAEQFLDLFPHISSYEDFGPMAHGHAPDIQELIG